MGKINTTKNLPPIEQLRGRTLGRVLIKMGVLTREKVHECLKIQKQRRGTVRGLKTDNSSFRIPANRPDIP